MVSVGWLALGLGGTFEEHAPTTIESARTPARRRGFTLGGRA
jgi:hypothetical protein